MNDCYFMGNLGRDPVVKVTQTGKTYARFSIGCSEKWGDKEITNWVNVVCWDNVAQAVGNYLTKGKLVMVKGRWTSRKYTDQKTGEVKYTTELNAQERLRPISTHAGLPGSASLEARRRSRSSQACSLREAVSLPGRGCSPRMTTHFDRGVQNALDRIV